MDRSPAAIRNVLLRALPADDFALLEPHLTRVAMPVRFQLHQAKHKIEHVYFPEDGIVSIVALMLDGKQCEVGIFGREGMSETATVLGTDYSPHSAYVQVPGTAALRLPVAVLNDAFETSRTLRRHLLRYAQAMMIQLSSSIAAAGLTIEQRLARWLLMCHDRIDGNDIHLTHEFVSMMLNVRRAGVTVALTMLEERGLIGCTRSNIVVRDRNGLTRVAEGSYGLAESEYRRLIGSPLGRATDGRMPAAA